MPVAREDITADVLREVFDRGLSYRAAGKELGAHHSTIKKWAHTYGVAPARPRGVPPARLDDLHSLCSKCGSATRNDEFPYVINRTDGRRLSYCRSCRKKQNRAATNASPASFWRERQGRIRLRAEHDNIPFALPSGYLLSLWERQGGRCFYTDVPLELRTREPSDRPHAPSVDKIIIERGYVQGNVVICSSRANSIKYDQTLDELREWMPGWYARVVDAWRSIGLTVFQVAPGIF